MLTTRRGDDERNQPTNLVILNVEQIRTSESSRCLAHLVQLSIINNAMIPPTLSNIILLPLLALISIPLILSAYITTVLSIFAICIRFSLIYIELCYAIVSSYFVIPTPTDSLLSFTVSRPSTPGSSSSNADKGAVAAGPGIPRSASAQHLPFYGQPYRPSRPGAKRFNSSMSLIGHDAHAKAMHNQALKSGMTISPPTPLLGFISGDEGRDFEDMGGWRHSRYKPASQSPAATDPSPGDEEVELESDSPDSDDRAWLSINERLSLPSQVVAQHSPREIHALSTPSAGRHHKRSSTTSMLTSSTRFGSGLVLALSNRNRPLDTPGSASASASPDEWRTSGSPSAGRRTARDGGYFALRPQSSSAGWGHGTLGSTAATSPRAPGENSPGLDRFMAHYSVGVRHRRRSTSGLPRGNRRQGE